MSGRPAAKGRIGLHGDGWGSYRRFEGDSVELGPLAPLPCRVSFHCDALGETPEMEIGLHPGENAHAVVLEAASD